MKTQNKLTMALITMFIIAGLALGGCSERSPLQPGDYEDEPATVSTLSKKPAGKGNGKKTGTGDNTQEDNNQEAGKTKITGKGGESRFGIGGE